MKPIKQTLLGRLLCWLGIHQVVWGQVDREPFNFSLYGGCVRCNRSFGWDA